MKYFDINTEARRPTIKNKLLTPIKRLHDIQRKVEEDVLKIGGVFFTFKATPVAPGMIDLGKSREELLKESEEEMIRMINGDALERAYPIERDTAFRAICKM